MFVRKVYKENLGEIDKDKVTKQASADLEKTKSLVESRR